MNFMTLKATDDVLEWNFQVALNTFKMYFYDWL